VHYAVINEMDYNALRATEIPDESIHLLIDPLPDAPVSGADKPSRDRIAAGLAAYASDAGQSFDPDSRLLLYPIRTIRRKNVLEAAVLSRLIEDANLIVTLPGVSDAERPYSELIQYVYAHGLVTGVWGIGRQEHRYGLSFDDLTHGCDLIVSTSVQEGFGLLFINALRWQVPLFARRLPILDGIAPVFDGYPVSFYDQFVVPTSTPSVRSMTAYLRMRYEERLDSLESALPDAARARLEGQIEELLTDTTIDFSFLPPQMQVTVLTDLGSPGFADEVRSLNKATIEKIDSTIEGRVVDRSEAISRVLGYRAFADRFQEVVQRTLGDSGNVRTEDDPDRYLGAQDLLVERFADLRSLRLLLAPFERA
jgi:hypothetical protein